MEDDLVDYEEAYDLTLSPNRKMTVLLPKGLEDVPSSTLGSHATEQTTPSEKKLRYA